MAALIDWHSHHTPPELAEDFVRLTGKAPYADKYDSSDFDRRVRELDAAGIDVQLICQGAGIYADRFSADQAIEIVLKSNDVVAERIAPHRDRLFGVMAVSQKDIPGSVAEIERNKGKGFRAVLLYPKTDGQFLLDSPEAEPLFAKISELKMPIFLHGATAANDPSLKRLEDEGAGVIYSVIADAAVCESVVRMIAGGVFDRHPDLKIVIRTGGGGLPLLLHRLFWKHKGPNGEERYADILLRHFWIDTAGVDARTLRFLLDTLGEDRIVFGSDYCGGLGALEKALPVIEDQPDPSRIKALTERTSRSLLGI
ncbi:MAG TPA: amidohydrolase family protein [Candidatus Binatia bacterium]|jgi:predicted TIM-barrel fold metal-dependent hydrolase